MTSTKIDSYLHRLKRIPKNLIPTIPESPDNSTTALETSLAFKIAPLPTSGIRE